MAETEEKSLLGAAANNEGHKGGDNAGGNGSGDDAAAKAAADKAAADAAAAKANDQAAGAEAIKKQEFETNWKATQHKELETKLKSEGKTDAEITSALDKAYKEAFDAAFIPKQGAPEKYADFKLPEGLTLNTAMSDKFKDVAKKLNLTQEQAQQLVDFQANAVKQQSESQLEAFNQQVKGWAEASKKYLGADAEKKLSVAAKARDMFGSTELTQLLDDSGLGNHPEVVKFFLKVGERISEDKFIPGNAASDNSEKSMAEKLYGKKPK